MFQKFKIAALSAILGLGTLAVVPATAQAGSISIGISSHGPSLVRYHRHWRACTPRRALRKARRIGINRAYIRRINRRTIRVDGHRHGHRSHVVFARTRHCPVIRYHR